MKRRLTTLAITALAAVALISVISTVTTPANADGETTQIAGNGYFPPDPDGSGRLCDNPPPDPVPGVLDVLNLDMTGDLEGCLYSYVLTAKCSPSGTYNETGIDIFVTADGNSTFQTTYRFTAKYTECNVETDTPGGDEIFGRCQHPLTPGLGTGIYEGVTGRFDIKDIIDKDNVLIALEYRGHLKGLQSE